MGQILRAFSTMITPHKLLHIPEIVSLVLNYADNQTLFASALVCKAWLEPALDELWKCVKDPFVLFNLLGPMHLISADVVRVDFVVIC
jgi:hypothetical protein